MFKDTSNLTTTLTITENITSYYGMFQKTATQSPAQITVNYTASASSLIDKIIGTKTSTSNVVKSEQI